MHYNNSVESDVFNWLHPSRDLSVCLLCLLISLHYSIIDSPSSHSKTVQLLLLLEDKEEKEKVCRMFRLLFPYNESDD